MLRVLTAILALTLLSSNWATATPYPIDQWARRAAISNIQISPDGRYLGLKKVSGKGANPIIETTTPTISVPNLFESTPSPWRS